MTNFDLIGYVRELEEERDRWKDRWRATVEDAEAARQELHNLKFNIKEGETGPDEDYDTLEQKILNLSVVNGEHHNLEDWPVVVKALSDHLDSVRKETISSTLLEARKVISQYLGTAEQWRYDRVLWAFAIMLGEIPEDSPEPEAPRYLP